MMKKKNKKKYIPVFCGFNRCHNKDFYCYYEEGVYDKYGLHFTTDLCNGYIEKRDLKGKKYGKPPYSFNTYEEMMKKSEELYRACAIAEGIGNIRKKAVYIILELDENGKPLYDAHSFDGYVSKRGTVFNITSSGTYNGKKRFTLRDEDKHLVFSDIVKAACYIEENYGHWAASHYLKSFPNSL